MNADCLTSANSLWKKGRRSSPCSEKGVWCHDEGMCPSREDSSSGCSWVSGSSRPGALQTWAHTHTSSLCFLSCFTSSLPSLTWIWLFILARTLRYLWISGNSPSSELAAFPGCDRTYGGAVKKKNKIGRHLVPSRQGLSSLWCPKKPSWKMSPRCVAGYNSI